VAEKFANNLLPFFECRKPSSLLSETVASRAASILPMTRNVPVATPTPFGLTPIVSATRTEPLSRESELVDVPDRLACVTVPAGILVGVAPALVGVLVTEQLCVFTFPDAVKCAVTALRLRGLLWSATAMLVTISAATAASRTPNFIRDMSPPLSRNGV
jgi:hypothetical protein